MKTSMFPLPLVIYLLRKVWAEQALISPRAAFYSTYLYVHFLMSKDRKNHIQGKLNVQVLAGGPDPGTEELQVHPWLKLRKISVFVTHWAAKGNFCKNEFKPLGKILNLWLHSYECICLYMKLTYFYDTFFCSWFIQIFFSFACNWCLSQFFTSDSVS